MKRFGQRIRGNSFGRKADHSSPLRKIVGMEQVSIGTTETGIDVWIDKERLECGHLVRIKQDLFGETNAQRRRCKQCADVQNDA